MLRAKKAHLKLRRRAELEEGSKVSGAVVVLCGSYSSTSRFMIRRRCLNRLTDTHH